MKLKRLKCGCEGAYKYGHMKGYQRYRCKNCGYQFTKTTPRGRPEKDKILALVLYLSGLSMSAIGKILGVTAQSVMRWIRKMYDKFITKSLIFQQQKRWKWTRCIIITKKNSKTMDLKNY